MKALGVRAVVVSLGPKQQGCAMGQPARSQDPHGFQAEGAAFWKAWRHILVKIMARPRISRRAVCYSRAAVPSCGLAVLCLQESRCGRRTRQPHGSSLSPSPFADPRQGGGAGGAL